MTPRIVVFGGRGFIGSSIVRDLGMATVAPPRTEVDLTRPDDIRRVLLPGDVVINATGYAAATDRSTAGLARLRRDNVVAVETLADTAAETGAAQLIHLSSVAAMGQRAGTALTEKDMRPPRSPYGQSKLDAETALAARAGRLPITILRPTSVFGEGRGLAAFLCRIADLPLLPLPAGGRALVPFTYIGNIVEAVRLSIGSDACLGRTFIVGDDRSYQLGDVLRALALALGHDHARTMSVPTGLLSTVGIVEGGVRRAIGGSPLLDPIRIETLTTSVSYSTAGFRDATGYEPPHDLDDGVARIAAWHRRRTGR
jgi:UDP-glucose 4-epimerase